MARRSSAFTVPKKLSSRGSVRNPVRYVVLAYRSISSLMHSWRRTSARLFRALSLFTQPVGRPAPRLVDGQHRCGEEQEEPAAGVDGELEPFGTEVGEG